MKLNRLYRFTTKRRNQNRFAVAMCGFTVFYIAVHAVWAWSKGIIP